MTKPHKIPQLVQYFFIFMGWLSLIGLSSAVLATELSMSITTSPTQAVVNENITYTITVFSTRSAVNEVILTYGLPPSFNFVSTKTSQGTCKSGDIIKCDLNTIADKMVIVTIAVTPTQEGSFSSNVNANGISIDEVGNSTTASNGGVLTSTSEAIKTEVAPLPEVTLSFSETTYTITEAGPEATVTVTRDNTGLASSVDVATSDGSATAQQDYTPVTTTLNWKEGDAEPKTFTILINNDLETEDEETINLTMSNPVGATIINANALIKITDDEQPGDVSFSAADYNVGEMDKELTITVRRTGGSDGTLSVNYATSNETAVAEQDYTAAQGQLTWLDGDQAPKTFTLSVVDDDNIEGEEIFLITLSQPNNRATLGQALATVHLLDNVSVNDAVAALTGVARNPTQLAMANTLGNLCQSGQASENLQQRCTEMIVNAETQPGSVSNALQQIAPEEYASQGRMSIEAASRQLRNISSRLTALRSGATGWEVENVRIDFKGQTIPLPNDSEFRLKGQPLPGQTSTQLPNDTAHAFDLYKLGVFVNGNISFGDKNATTRESGFDFNALALTGGIDYRFSDQFILGLALGYNVAQAELYDDGGDIDMENLNLSVYGSFYQAEKYYVDLLYSYGITWYDNSRHVSYRIGGIEVDQVANSDHDGDQQILSFSGGYHMHFKPMTLTPTVRIDYLTAGINDFRETMSSSETAGSGLALAIDKQNIKSLSLALGAKVALELTQASGTIFIPELSLELVMETQNKERLISGYFVEDAGRERFGLQTDAPDTSYINFGLGLAIQADKGKSAFISYNTLFGLNDVTNHSLMAGIRLEF